MATRNRGFTLVELLVVIVIIGVLAGLLAGAAISAREAARRATCVNNQEQIGLAIMHYESERSHLPGFLNNALPGVTGNMSWAMAILPYVGRADIVTAAQNAKSWASVGVGVNDYVCPDDPQKSLGAVTLLSYVVPYQMPQPTGATIPPYLFLNRSGATSASPAVTVVISQIPNPVQTVMLGEYTGPAADGAPRNWTDVSTTATHFTFSPTSGAAVSSATLTTSLRTAHPGVAVVCYFDRHVAQMPDTTAFNADGTLTEPQ